MTKCNLKQHFSLHLVFRRCRIKGLEMQKPNARRIWAIFRRFLNCLTLWQLYFSPCWKAGLKSGFDAEKAPFHRDFWLNEVQPFSWFDVPCWQTSTALLPDLLFCIEQRPVISHQKFIVSFYFVSFPVHFQSDIKKVIWYISMSNFHFHKYRQNEYFFTTLPIILHHFAWCLFIFC